MWRTCSSWTLQILCSLSRERSQGICANPSTCPKCLNSEGSACLLWKHGGSDGKVSTCNAGDLNSIPGSGRSPGEGNGNPLQYPCLENSMHGGAGWATVHGIAKSQTLLSIFTFTFLWKSKFNTIIQSNALEWPSKNTCFKQWLHFIA